MNQKQKGEYISLSQYYSVSLLILLLILSYQLAAQTISYSDQKSPISIEKAKSKFRIPKSQFSVIPSFHCSIIPIAQ